MDSGVGRPTVMSNEEYRALRRGHRERHAALVGRLSGCVGGRRQNLAVISYMLSVSWLTTMTSGHPLALRAQVRDAQLAWGG